MKSIAIYTSQSQSPPFFPSSSHLTRNFFRSLGQRSSTSNSTLRASVSFTSYRVRNSSYSYSIILLANIPKTPPIHPTPIPIPHISFTPLHSSISFVLQEVRKARCWAIMLRMRVRLIGVIGVVVGRRRGGRLLSFLLRLLDERMSQLQVKCCLL